MNKLYQILKNNFEEVKNLPNEWGRLVESAVGAHLKNHSVVKGMELTYWRKGNFEVDFILKHKNKYLAIEVKSGKSSIRLSGLKKFAENYPETKTMVVGKTISVEEFLKTSPEDLL